jgi:hypothetical protein
MTADLLDQLDQRSHVVATRPLEPAQRMTISAPSRVASSSGWSANIPARHRDEIFVPFQLPWLASSLACRSADPAHLLNRGSFPIGVGPSGGKRHLFLLGFRGQEL